MQIDRRELVQAALAGAALQGCGGPAADRPRTEEAAPAPGSRDARPPAVFVSHGSPDWALTPEKGADWAAWSRRLGTPSALLVVSAHWEATPLAVGATSTRELLYDFAGFPPELSRVRYRAPGAPELERRVRDVLPELVSRPERPWDHGVWVPLVHMFPDADVPLLQLSLPTDLPPSELFALGRRLAPLRDEGVLVMGSGGMVHNLGALAWGRDDAPTPAWATDFEGWVRGALDGGDYERLFDFASTAPAPRRAHPTTEHFLPLFVALGAGAADGVPPRYAVEGFELGSLR